MANSFFQFKQFTIHHDKCAMKVGTDGVLLGAWATIGESKNILDVGTGTGIIALMLAQRSHAIINAIDIDAEACLQAKENAALSPFARQIYITQADFTEYAASCRQKQDLIVSNPPYFVNSLKCPNGKRNLARHTDTLLLADLIQGSKNLLSSTGRLALILPYERQEELAGIATENGLSIIRKTDVVPVAGSAPKRVLAELSAMQSFIYSSDTLTIEEARHQYTQEYIALTKEFYLKM